MNKNGDSNNKKKIGRNETQNKSLKKKQDTF